MTIDRAGIHHRPTTSDSHAVDTETVEVRLRSARGNLDECALLHGDKFDWPASAQTTAMERVHRDAEYDYWTLRVTPPHRRLVYAFRLRAGDDELWLTEWGFEDADGVAYPTGGAERPLHYFEHPYLNAGDVIAPPEWVENAVFYQIFPDRFENGDPGRTPDGAAAWGDQPTNTNVFGGDLQGVIDRLDYLDELGVTALYLTPVFASESNHKYNVADYGHVDPAFGDTETLSRLVDRAHERGIRVVLDAVFNHCGRQFEPFQDVVEHGADSAYADWFHVHEFPIQFEPRPTYDAWGFEAHMPKLNTEHPEVRAYLIDVAVEWMEETGVDGWRLDVADEVDHGFWRAFRDAVKAANPEAYVLGEVWHDARPWLGGDQFDATMNYPFTYAVDGFLTEESIDGRAFADRVGRFLFRYPDATNRVLFNLLGSHDTARLRHRCDGDTDRVRLAMLALFTAVGVPCVYYGDEVGMSGGDDPDCRRTMVWDPAERDEALRTYVQELITVRRERAALTAGDVRFVHDQCGGDLVVYRRTAGEQGDGLTVAINRGDEPVTVEVGDDRSAAPTVVIASRDGAVRTVESGQITLAGVSGVVLES